MLRMVEIELASHSDDTQNLIERTDSEELAIRTPIKRREVLPVRVGPNEMCYTKWVCDWWRCAIRRGRCDLPDVDDSIFGTVKVLITGCYRCRK